jgi:hypothetical protein
MPPPSPSARSEPRSPPGPTLAASYKRSLIGTLVFIRLRAWLSPEGATCTRATTSVDRHTPADESVASRKT